MVTKKVQKDVATRRDLKEVSGVSDLMKALGLSDVNSDVSEELEGVDITLPEIKVLHQAQTFRFPDGTKRDRFEGIIINIAKYNVYWEEDFAEGSGNPPDCSSPDGITPSDMSSNKQSSSCKLCSKNVFGSKGRGKACQNRRNIYIVVKGEMLPHRLVLAPTGIKGLNSFISSNVLSKGLSKLQVLVEFSLSTAKNKDGVGYSDVAYNTVDVFKDKHSKESIASLRKSWMVLIQGQYSVQSKHEVESDVAYNEDYDGGSNVTHDEEESYGYSDEPSK